MQQPIVKTNIIAWNRKGRGIYRKYLVEIIETIDDTSGVFHYTFSITWLKDGKLAFHSGNDGMFYPSGEDAAQGAEYYIADRLAKMN